MSESPRWIDLHDPELADSGYNLVLYGRRTPFLMDMNGVARHTWPGVRVSGRARLLPNGHLVALSDRGRFTEHDWDGRLVWEFRSPGKRRFLHHDFAVLRNGNYLLLVSAPGTATDDLLEIDRSGKEVWRWHSHEGLSEDLGRARFRYDRTHINSVQELPENRWFDRGHQEFRPGNILVSARDLDALYIVARPGGEVVWRHYDGLDYQHEALMVPAGGPGAGNIVFFNNGYHNLAGNRQSAIVEVDPLDHSVAWSYRSPHFFSSTGGAQQVLPSGNVLVTSSRGGRVFELTREGRVVWQWAPPFLPMRALRYPHDHCPQLASRERPPEPRVDRRDPERHIDASLYGFAATQRPRRVRVDGQGVQLLRRENQCQQLLIPDAAELRVGYGIRGRGRCTPEGEESARFGVSIGVSGTETPENLLEETLRVEAATQGEGPVELRRETFSLARYARQTVDLCLSVASPAGGAPSGCFVWETPLIRPTGRPPERPARDEVDAEVRQYQKEQLEVLGYIN